MTTISSSSVSPYLDRTAYIERLAKSSNGQFTVEDVTKQQDQADLAQMHIAETAAKLNRGEGVYLGSFKGGIPFYDPAQATAVRTPVYGDYKRSDPNELVTIDAVDVDFAVGHQEKLCGHDLKDLSYYADYLKGEVAAATEQNANF